jgi:hypothetical protein
VNWRRHPDVDPRRGLDLAEVNREAVGEQQQVPGRDSVFDLALPYLCLLLVREQDHHDVAAAGCVGDVQHLEPGGLGLRPALRVGTQAHHDRHA